MTSSFQRSPRLLATLLALWLPKSWFAKGVSLLKHLVLDTKPRGCTADTLSGTWPLVLYPPLSRGSLGDRSLCLAGLRHTSYQTHSLHPWL